MISRFLLSFLLIGVVHSGQLASYTDEYSWRDYEGVIPPDALPAGLDRAGKPIYIGQALFEDKLIPGNIYEGDPNVYIEWREKEHAKKDNARILCTNQPQKFEWLDTKKNEIAYLTNRILLKGGYEAGYSTYIGRAVANGETLIGKLMCRTDDCLGLLTSKNGVVHSHGLFQILSYNSSAPHISIPSCQNVVDVRNN